jgi:multiple sugar transport system permease protein
MTVTGSTEATGGTGQRTRSAGRPRGVDGVRRRPRLHEGQWWVGLLFLAPGLLSLVLLRLAPAVAAIGDSFRKVALDGTGQSHWIGWDNYARLVANDQFVGVLLTTLKFIVVVNPVQVVLALALAVVLSERVRGVVVVRMLVFLPVAAPAAVATLVWGIAFQPEGPINAMVTGVGLPRQPFLTSTSQALWCIVVLLSWVGLGYWTMFLIAGIQDIPRSLYEAAALDGAGWWMTLWHVTLPSMRRTLAFVLVADTMANFLTFAPIQILTNGGPQDSTRLIMFDIYDRAYNIGNINIAEAEVVLLLAVMVVITAVQFRLISRER